MDHVYNETYKIYKILAEELLNESINLVNKNRKADKIPIVVNCLRDKAVIPLIESSAKSNFLTYSNQNVYTKDDPILRYIPSTKSNQQSSITWYEGAVFGTKSFDETNMVDFMFIKICIIKNKGLDGINFLKAKFGRDPSNLFNSNNTKVGELEQNDVKYNIDNLFCSICCVFDCGIHKNDERSKVLNIDEPTECYCKRNNDNEISKTLNKKKNINRDGLFEQMNGKISPCLAKLIYEAETGESIDCKKFMKLKTNRKNFTLSRRTVDPLQFYEPCNHIGKCIKNNCNCASKNTYCEIYCSCTDCSNIFYCSCKVCTDECPCRVVARECTVLCMCEEDSKNCINRPIKNNDEKQASICRSLKHGLGLFAEEFIPKNSFVFQYTGELITDKEAERRGNFYELNQLSYLFNCCNDNNSCLYSIDAFFLGNKSRFINHSVSNANLKSEIIISNGIVKIVFYSLRDIYKGEEFLFDYKFTDEHKLKHGIKD